VRRQGQIHLLYRGLHYAFQALCPHSLEARPKGQVLLNGERWHQNVLLRASAQHPSDIGRRTADIQPEDLGGPRSDCRLAREHVDGGGLAGAVVAEQYKDLPDSHV
jgi:hypothetical protein